MSSTAAILVFGIDFGDKDVFKIIKEASLKNNLTKLSREFIEKLENFEAMILAESGLSYSSDFKTRLKAKENYPVECIMHYSDDYGMYILAVNGTDVTVNVGSPRVVDPKTLVVSEEKILAFKEWCEKHGLEYQEPQWLLCSYKG